MAHFQGFPFRKSRTISLLQPEAFFLLATHVTRGRTQAYAGMPATPPWQVLLQAGIEGTELYQSPTQRFTRWVWVYQVPIIICTNEWISDRDRDATARWIRENQVHIHVKDYMYNRMADADMT